MNASDRRTAAARALATVPGWAGATLTELEGGLSNSTWLAERDGERAVLKFDPARRAFPYNTRPAEGAVQTMAAGEGLAARVLHVSDTVLLSEFAEGEVWTRADVHDPSRLVELAKALRRVHRLPLIGRTFDAREAAKLYYDHLGDADAVVAGRCLQTVLETQLPGHLSVCHNDLVTANIVDAGGICFIDWEFACDNDPLFDLATIVAHNELSSDQAGELLDAYFDGDGSRWLDALAVQERLHDALLWLWRESRDRI
ncbi:MAG: phosphotransferase [Pseudomonadota bacterium]